MYDLERFRTAQRADYPRALAEIRRGRKCSCWMWYIFPQLRQLGHSSTALYYGLEDAGEARAFLADPELGGNLREITDALLALESCSPGRVMGYPDDLKLCSCMTLFAAVSPDDQRFPAVLDKFFGGKQDDLTLAILNRK